MPRFSRLQVFLILVQCCIAWGAVQGQEAPSQPGQSGDSSADDTTPASPSFSAPPPGPSYYPRSTEPSTYGEPGLGIVQRLPSSELGSPQYGVPYSSVFSLTGADGDSVNPLTAHSLEANANGYPKIGDLEGTVSIANAGAQLTNIPFIYHAFPPEDADLKAGPFYLKFDRFEADLLYTDNYRLSHTGQHEETLVILSLNMTLIAQLTDDLQLAINGTVVYLPIQNIVGFESSSLDGGLGFLLAAIPLMRSQLTYDTLIAGWNVQFADTFQVTTGNYSDSTRDQFNLFQSGELQAQSQGNYTFHSGHANLRDNNTNSDNSQQDYFSAFVNTISALTTHDLPGDIQFTARAERSDLWYNQGNRGLPSSREDLTLLAEEVRPNMRFTPYSSYELSHSSDVPGVYQTFRIGLYGPITDQLFLNTNVGYFISTTGHQDAVWTLNLRHVAGEYTTEYLGVERGLSDFNDEVYTSELYRITQVLGPTLTAEAFAENSQVQELINDQSPNRSQQDYGASLTWLLGPKTTLTLSGIYTHQDFTDGFLTDTWTGRISLWRTISDTLFFRALYQYQRFHTNQSSNNYSESLVYLSLIKYFP